MDKSPQKEYAVLRRREEWKIFRNSILELDNYTCTKCRKCYSNAKHLLHVHHKTYYPGKKPWEYDPEDVTTYCRRCHAEEHGLVEWPQFGWEYVGYEDLGDLIGECEKCEHELRYQHTVYHPEIGYLYVGATCADILLDSVEASNVEKREKRRNASLDKWKEVSPGRFLFSNCVNYQLVVEKSDDCWCLSVDNYTLNELFSTSEEAKLFAFDIVHGGMIETLAQEGYEEHYKKFSELQEWVDIQTEKVHSVQIVCFGHIIDVDKIKKRIICRSYPCYWDEKIYYEINYRVSIDFFNLGIYKSIDEAKIRAFDLTFSPKKYNKIINKAQKSFYKHITNSIHWRKSDESIAYRIYERGGYFARIHLYQDQYILELKHRNLSFYIPGTKKQHYTKIGDFENEASAMEKAYSLFCTPIELEPLLLRDPYIYFMDSRNWNIVNNSLDREIHKNVLSDIDIEICKEDLWRFTMKIGSLQGNKTFRSIEKAKEIAYDFITSGKYSKFVKAHT